MNDQDILGELRFIGDQLQKLVALTEQSVAANEPALYCPPDNHCPGGVRLMKHAPKYWKNDGKDADRYYHPLPEQDYWVFKGEGAFNGSTVRNHNVWRSQALTDGHEDAGPDVRDDVDTTTGEMREPLTHGTERLIANTDLTTDKAAQTYVSTRATNAGLRSPQIMAYLGIEDASRFWDAIAVRLLHNSPRGVFEEGVALLLQEVQEANAVRR